MCRQPLTEDRARLLTDPYNRAIVRLLDDAEGSLHVEELADRLVSRDAAVLRSSEYEERIEQAYISLHHDRLPKLAEAGLLEYDVEANVVRALESPTPDVEWHDSTMIDELVEHLGADAGSNGEGFQVLRGRESVIEYGRRLADEAEEELFCIYVSTDLLEEECVRRGRNAIDRGVAMFMGSGNPEVRALTREHLSEATIWEPQLDWLNTQTYPRVGRLVLIDRRKAMLAILEEPEADGTHPDETAVVGEGEDHPLVVLVRELLGPRLDHLDYQSEEFRSELSI